MLCYGKRKTIGDSLIANRKEDWITVPGAHAGIIEASDYDKVQDILSCNLRPTSWNESSPHLLGGLGRCGNCGSRIVGVGTRRKNTGKVNRYYRCLGRIQKGLSFCQGLAYRAVELEEAITSQIVGFDVKSLQKEITQYRQHTAQNRGALVAQQEKLSAEFEKSREKEFKLLELYEDNIIDLDLFKERQRQLERQKLAVAAELAEVESRLPEDKLATIDPKVIARQFADIKETFPALSVFEKRKLLQAIISEFTAWPDGRVEVDFNLLNGMDLTGIPLDQYRHIDIRKKSELQSLGGAIRSYRIDAGLTQKELAGELGVNAYTICQWERDVRVPSVSIRKRIQQVGFDGEQ